MNSAHSRWPLFSNDLRQAQMWVMGQLTITPSDKLLGHQALSLGLSEEIRKILNLRNQNIEESTRRQWKFRLARLSGAVNPYSELIPPDLQALTSLTMDYFQRANLPAVVSLGGGIGDHLEVISMLLSWIRKSKQQLRLQVTPQNRVILEP